MKSNPAFSYIYGTTVLHRTPAWIKILILPVTSIAVFQTGPAVPVILIAIQLVLCLAAGFKVRQILSDLKPIIWYAGLLYITGLIGMFFTKQVNLIPDAQSLTMLSRLVAVMLSASLMFRTSTQLQLRQAIGQIEHTIRKVLHLKDHNTVTEMVSLFICFIPMVSRNWSQCRRAWLARGGKTGITMYKALFPVFFSVSIKQAYNAGKALSARIR